MPIYCCRIELHIPAACSLKDKRQVLRSIQDRMRAACHASVAECGYQDTWQRASVLASFAVSDQSGLQNLSDLMRRIVDDNDEVAVLSWNEEVCEP